MVKQPKLLGASDWSTCKIPPHLAFTLDFRTPIGQVRIGLDASCREPPFSNHQPFTPAGGQIQKPGWAGPRRRDKAGSATDAKPPNRSRRELNR